MKHRPILVDVLASAMNQYDCTPEQALVDGLDVSAILAEIIGRDDDRIVAFLHEPHEFPQIDEAVRIHPDVNWQGAFVDTSTDWADAIYPGLHKDADEEEIVRAWNAWLDAYEVETGFTSWADLRWSTRRDEIAAWLEDDRRPSRTLLVEMARMLLEDASFREAIIEAARTPRVDPLESLRACAALEAMPQPV